MTTRRRRRQDVEIEREVIRLARVGFTPPEIHEYLKKAYRGPSGEERAPSLRTIQRVVAEMPAPGASWSFRDSTAEEAGVALEALRGLDWPGQALWRKAPDGSGWLGRNQTTWWPTRRQVEWLARLRDVLPELPIVPAWYYAEEYMRREDHGEDTQALDLALAFAPKEAETDLEMLNRLMNHAHIHLDRWPGTIFYAYTNDRAQPFIAELVEVTIYEHFKAGSLGPPERIIWRPTSFSLTYLWPPGGHGGDIYRSLSRIEQATGKNRREALDQYIQETFKDGLSPTERPSRKVGEDIDNEPQR